MNQQGLIPVNPFQKGEEEFRRIRRPEPTKYISIVFAVSASVYMKPFWQHLAANVSRSQAYLRDAMPGSTWQDAEIRMRFIAFRDMYMYTDPFVSSPFCHLPREAGELERFARDLTYRGLGRYKSSGLEALFLAMHSDWAWNDNAVKHVIVLVADTLPYELRSPLRSFDKRYESVLNGLISNHDLPVPENLEEFRMCWLNGVGTMDNWNNFLLLYVPECAEWQEIATWDEVTIHPMAVDRIPYLTVQEVFSDVCRVSGMM